MKQTKTKTKKKPYPETRGSYLQRLIPVGAFGDFFAGSEPGPWRAAIIYSLVASCKLNGRDPFAYFNDVLRRVSIHPADKIDELLPGNWKKPNSGTEDDSVVKDQIVQVA